MYEGFGKVIAQNGGGGGPYQFCGLWGYRNDYDAGLIHLGARYYEPENGRWVQKDLIFGASMHPQTLNRYVYVTNDPINNIDPYGTWKWTIVGAVVGAVVGGVFGWFLFGGPVGAVGGAIVGASLGVYIGHHFDIYEEVEKVIKEGSIGKRVKEIEKMIHD